MNFTEHLWNISLALDQAQLAYNLGEVPVGAVLVDEYGKVISVGHNTKESENDPCGHAEIVALRAAARKLNGWRLTGSTLFVTLEPCPMCLAAMQQSRVKRLVFGAYDSKGGALSLGYNLYKDGRLNHQFEVIGGIRHFECSKVLSDFFKKRRKEYNAIKK